MFVDLQNKYDWVLRPVIGYPSVDRLIDGIEEEIVRPAEAKFKERQVRRAEQLRAETIPACSGPSCRHELTPQRKAST
jgi:hypothetical protein